MEAFGGGQIDVKSVVLSIAILIGSGLIWFFTSIMAGPMSVWGNRMSKGFRFYRVLLKTFFTRLVIVVGNF